MTIEKKAICAIQHYQIRNSTTILCGVPQGSVLGPLLFTIYINYLTTCLSNYNAILFSDDTTLYSSSSSFQELYQSTNTDLKQLDEWFRSNKISIVFSHKKDQIPDKWFLHISLDHPSWNPMKGAIESIIWHRATLKRF